MSANTYSHSDQEIMNRICQKLYWDKRVSMTDIRVEADRGIITIKGVVDSDFKKRAALEVVATTDGVWNVKDEIVVKPNLVRSDDELKATILEEFNGFTLMPDERIVVTVHEGVAKLTGRVHQKRIKALAASFCWELSGVRDCLNQIVLIGSPTGLPAQAGDPVVLKDYIVSNVFNVSG